MDALCTVELFFGENITILIFVRFFLFAVLSKMCNKGVEVAGCKRVLNAEVALYERLQVCIAKVVTQIGEQRLGAQHG